MDIDARIDELLANLEPITLDEMKEIRLMNRTDTKFVTNKENLARLLELAQGKYYAQFHCNAKIANYMTTYWDTDEYRFYLEHHNGRAPRQKVRVRTYMDSDDTFLDNINWSKPNMSSRPLSLPGIPRSAYMGVIPTDITTISRTAMPIRPCHSNCRPMAAPKSACRSTSLSSTECRPNTVSK